MDLPRDFLGGAIIFLILIALILLALNLAVPSQPGLTELYFIGDLPKQVEPGQKYNFSFGIRNLENTAMNYSFAVDLGPSQVDQGTAALAPGQAAVMTARFSVTDAAQNTSLPVTIRLAGKNQKIIFWTVIQ